MNFCCCSIISSIRALRIAEKRPHFPLAQCEATSLGDSQLKLYCQLENVSHAALFCYFHLILCQQFHYIRCLSNKKYLINYAFKTIEIPNKSF